MTKNFITLDIGGTSIKSAIVKSDGTFDKNSYKLTYIDSTKNKDYIVQKFIEPIKEKINFLSKFNKNLDGIAISICGPFDYKNGISLIKNLDKYESIYKLNIKKIIQEKLSLSSDIPLIFDIDSWCFGRGETCFNDYNNYKKIIVFTVGTGLGSCFIDNKKVIGEGVGVPWLGWISGQKYKSGILNDYVSGVYMQKKYFENTKEGIDIKTMADRARNNDTTAKLIFSEMGSRLGDFLKENFIEEFKTECIIFGGQISFSSELFIDEIKIKLKDKINLQNIVQAKDIELSALRGAAQLLNDNN